VRGAPPARARRRRPGTLLLGAALSAATLLAQPLLPIPASPLAGQEGGTTDRERRETRETDREHRGHESEPGSVGSADPVRWRMPPMNTSMPMLPSVMGLRPRAKPFLPMRDVDPSSLPEARPREVVELSDGDSLRLVATPVRRTIDGHTLRMWGYNGQYPGPLLKVDQGAEIVVEFVNEIEMPSTIHWHGIRVENRFDGVPGVTQEPVAPGERFTYRVRFRDAGIYWYHPHLREDVQQDLGLYGNILVDPAAKEYWSPVNRESFLMLDDLLLDGEGLFPFGEEAAVHTLMGRFGNVLLVNGEPAPGWKLEVDRGEVVRFYVTNVSNTRTFNLAFGDAPVKLVAADLGRFERERRVGSVVVAPAQRYVVEVRFEEPGDHALTNRIQALDHYRAEFYSRVDTLGTVHVTEESSGESHTAAFERLRENEDVRSEIERALGEHFDDPLEHRLELTMEGRDLPLTVRQMMALDTLYMPPVEWNDVMPMMNFASSSRDVRWILRDPETGAENDEIDWSFEVGDVAKIEIHNSSRSLHPMQHPIHLHGQRFVVLERDGVRNENLVWKDTVLVPVGATVILLVEFSNPGDWMLHCHIAEHLEAGMMTTFHVEAEATPRAGAASAGTTERASRSHSHSHPGSSGHRH